MRGWRNGRRAGLRGQWASARGGSTPLPRTDFEKIIVTMINLKDFKKLDIRIGKIISAEKVPDTDKLVKLILDIGGEERQVVAGIAEAYPDTKELIGKEIPILLNLEPRELRGEMSNGMILAADNDGKPVLLHPDKEIPPGSRVK